MAKIDFKPGNLSILTGFTSGLQAKVQARSNPKALELKIKKNFAKVVTRRIEKLQEEQIRQAVGKVIASAFKTSPVIKGLLGGFAGDKTGADLQAEFGLTATMAARACQELLNYLIKYGVHVNKKNMIVHERTGFVDFSVSVLAPKSYTMYLKAASGSEPFAYESKPYIQNRKTVARYLNTAKKKKKDYKPRHLDSKSLLRVLKGHKIYWLRWLMAGSSINSAMRKDIPGVQNFGITYTLSSKETNVVSRSGRAIMVSSKDYRRGGRPSSSRDEGRAESIGSVKRGAKGESFSEIGKVVSGINYEIKLPKPQRSVDRFPYVIPTFYATGGDMEAVHFIDQIARNINFRDAARKAILSIVKAKLKGAVKLVR